MKFLINRASDYENKAQPCKNAKLEPIQATGYNKYSIELESLDDLQRLIKEVGELIVYEDKITIYDEYIE